MSCAPCPAEKIKAERRPSSRCGAEVLGVPQARQRPTSRVLRNTQPNLPVSGVLERTGRRLQLLEHVGEGLHRRLVVVLDDPVFVGEGGGYLDASALRRRFVVARDQAKLRPLRFHDLRHSFGSLAARMAESPRELQEWMGHADLKTTARYTYYQRRGGEASRLARAFAVSEPMAVDETGQAPELEAIGAEPLQ